MKKIIEISKYEYKLIVRYNEFNRIFNSNDFITVFMFNNKYYLLED